MRMPVLLHRRFILRQISSSKKQSLVFVLCVALSLSSLVALDGFARSVDRALLQDARALHAADIIVRSSYPLSDSMLNAVERLEKQGEIRSARGYAFYSVVRSRKNPAGVLAALKVVEKGYPFYGRVTLASGRDFKNALAPGGVVAERTLLDRLELKVGDSIKVGGADLKIEDVVLREPDRPLNFFSLGPRLFVSADDLTGLDLIQPGSRVQYMLFVEATSPRTLNQSYNVLRQAAAEGQERVDTFETAPSRIKRFFDNFLFFLGLIGIFILLLAGIGIQSALTALFRENAQTIAVVKTLGGDKNFIVFNFIAIIALLGGIGTILGISTGAIVEHFLPALLGRSVFQDIPVRLSWPAVGEGVGLGVFVVALFTFLPLQRIGKMKPVSIFRKDARAPRRDVAYYVSLCLVTLFFAGLVLLKIKEIRVGLLFTVGLVALIAATGAGAHLSMLALKKIQRATPTFRHAVRGLFRPGNATRSIIVTISAALTLFLTIYLIQANLESTFIRSFPSDAPNLFFVNIQPEQVGPIGKLLGGSPRFYPIVRARLTAINGQPIDRDVEAERRGDNLARTFNLTYRRDLLDDERITAGSGLFRKDPSEPQVSILDTVVEIKSMELGDLLTFNIQGVPLTARVSSIRTREEGTLKPFFYFVFQPDTLSKAPHTLFTAVRVPKAAASGLQQKIVSRFTNVSVIDVTQTIARFGELMHQFSLIVRFFTLFGMAAGGLIMISSLMATRHARVRQSVYYKILGAKRRFILAVFTLENLLIGGISAGVAMALSYPGAWLVCTRFFDIPFSGFWMSSGLLTAVLLAGIVAVGLPASLSVLRQRPMTFLMSQQE